MKRPFPLFALICVLCGSSPAAIPGAGEWRHEELRRFKAAEANQGVALAAAGYGPWAWRADIAFRRGDEEVTKPVLSGWKERSRIILP